VSRLSTECGSLHLSHPHRTPRPVTGIALLLHVVTTNNYNTIADFHTLQITGAHRLVFSVCYTLHYPFPGNGPEQWLFLCFRTQVFSELWLHSNGNILASVVLLITPFHGPSRKHSFQQYLFCCMLIIATETGVFAYLTVFA
jgi:hypothetical protein